MIVKAVIEPQNGPDGLGNYPRHDVQGEIQSRYHFIAMIIYESEMRIARVTMPNIYYTSFCRFSLLHEKTRGFSNYTKGGSTVALI